MSKKQDKNKDEDLIPNEQSTTMTESGANTPIEVASAKALHDEKVIEDTDLSSTEETTEEDFEKFNIDAVDKLEEDKDPEQKEED